MVSLRIIFWNRYTRMLYGCIFSIKERSGFIKKYFLERIILLNICNHSKVRLDFKNLSYLYSEKKNNFIFNVYVHFLEISTSLKFMNKILLIEGTQTLHHIIFIYKICFNYMIYVSICSWNHPNECNEACSSAGMLKYIFEISVCL